MAEETPNASAPAGEQVAEQRAPDTETKPAEQPAEAPQEKDAEKAAESEKEKPSGNYPVMDHLFLFCGPGSTLPTTPFCHPSPSYATSLTWLFRH